MKPVQKSHNNAILTAPNCEDLPVCKHNGIIYSYWKVSFKDRLKILFGRTIRLAVCSSKHPPVMLDTESV